ncbi:hypothetical protein PVAND_017190 [Polypedilum vanderplanki]|uniref:Ionotropic receptor n=1 Tax=Polypedilum vanderplanki TaxID=319348 RepID=A0A9J6BIQ3_POLVA|nr:hypothetical protein PVAND_017190 [Polypedilum vanderplanki]
MKTQKWIKNLEDFDHAENFHECLLSFLINLDHYFYTDKIQLCLTCTPNFEELVNPNAKLNGLNYELLNLLAKRKNFSAHYTFMQLQSDGEYFYGTQNFISPNKSFLMLFTGPIYIKGSYAKHMSEPIDTLDFYYLVSQNDPYNNYEKLLFPFDLTTWILFLFTLAMTFIVIFGLKIFPKWIQNVVFGLNVNNPAFNALGIFFGIGQTQVPHENFSRIILLLFIWFCLIFRTCWQSKMFEFMTTDMRKASPNSFDDIEKMQYKILVVKTSNNFQFYFNLELIGERERPYIGEYPFQTYAQIYRSALEGNFWQKTAFFINDNNHKQFNGIFGKTLETIKNERISKSITASMGKNNLIIYELNKLLNQLIPSGIPKYLSDYGFWLKFRPRDEVIVDTKKILSLNDLEFGFVIWLVSISIAILVFVVEILRFLSRKYFRKLIGLIGFEILLRKILRKVNFM